MHHATLSAIFIPQAKHILVVYNRELVDWYLFSVILDKLMNRDFANAEKSGT